MNAVLLDRLAAHDTGVTSEDRDAWLDRRFGGVTATEIAKLMKATAAGRRSLIEGKLNKRDRDLRFRRAARWGTVREAYIADWLQRRFNIEPNARLFHALDNERHLATPDGIGLDFDERVTVSEIKVSEFDLHPGPTVGGVLAIDPGPDSNRPFWQKGYYDQIQWQIYVLGADRARFTWEQHDGDWSGWPGRGPNPLEDEPRTVIILRDDFRIDELVAVAEEFLADLDAARGVEAGPGDVVLDALIARDVEASAAAKSARAALEAYVAKHSVESYRAPAGSVSYGLGNGSMRFDQTAFKAAHPALAQEFTRLVPPNKPTLRVTPAKGEEDE